MVDASLSFRARQWAHDIRRFHRQEQAQGHISPTDAAFLTRLQEFLESEVAPALEEVQATAATQPTP